MIEIKQLSRILGSAWDKFISLKVERKKKQKPAFGNSMFQMTKDRWSEFKQQETFREVFKPIAYFFWEKKFQRKRKKPCKVYSELQLNIERLQHLSVIRPCQQWLRKLRNRKKKLKRLMIVTSFLRFRSKANLFVKSLRIRK